MDRIVSTGIKIDLHIHSRYSSGKDGNLVKEGTIDNLPILLKKLEDNQINMCAITDHDCFNYDLYKNLKQHAGVGHLKCVLPGIEFSVLMNGDNNSSQEVHVIAIFDDRDEKKVQAISKLLPYNAIPYDKKETKEFSEEKFMEILSKIGLSAVLIVHQKLSVKSRKPLKRDLNILGEKTFNSLIRLDYFDSLEFKTKKQEVFHNIFQNEINQDNYERVRFITGSDCHQWEAYPRHDKQSKETEYEFVPTFLKCLPSFRGLVMSVTDCSRISRNNVFFDNNEKHLESISIRNGAQNIQIPLSKGINVIIGDNSSGKSALLNKISNYTCLDGSRSRSLPEELKTKYEEFWKSHKTIVENSFPEGSYVIDGQGAIRHQFEEKQNPGELLKEKYPEETDSAVYIDKIKEYLQPFYDALTNKFKFDSYKSELSSLEIVPEPSKTNICVAHQITKAYIQNSKPSYISKIISNLQKIKSELENSQKLKYTPEEKEKLKELKNYILTLETKYKKEESILSNNEQILNAINDGIIKYKSNTKALRDKETSDYDKYIGKKTVFAETIAFTVLYEHKLCKYTFPPTINDKINFNQKKYGSVVFVSRFKHSGEAITTKYLEELVMSVLIKNSTFPDTSKITKEKLMDIIANVNTGGGKTGVDLLKSKIENQLSDDYKTENAIVANGQVLTEQYSAGYNANQYFSLLAYDDHDKAYLVDQPEDDVSQTKIAESVVPSFKKMRERHQIIIVTHNPQFVINLDADNVIYVSSDKEKLNFKYGALEYKDEETDIIKLVEDNLDGGEEALRKRWKRYEKNSD